MILQHDRFTKCDTCVSLRAAIEQALDKETKKGLEKKLEEHFGVQA